MGIDPQQFSDLKKQDFDFEVWPENWDALEAFCAMATQWRVNPFGGVAGLDYVALNAVMDILGLRERKDVFQAVRVMESAALPILNKSGETKAHGRKKV